MKSTLPMHIHGSLILALSTSFSSGNAQTLQSGLFFRDLSLVEHFPQSAFCASGQSLAFFLAPPQCCWVKDSICVNFVTDSHISQGKLKSSQKKRHSHDIFFFLHVYAFARYWCLSFLFHEMFHVLSEHYFPIFMYQYEQPNLHKCKLKLRALEGKG